MKEIDQLSLHVLQLLFTLCNSYLRCVTTDSETEIETEIETETETETQTEGSKRWMS